MNGGLTCTLIPLKRVKRSAIPLNFLPRESNWNASTILTKPVLIPDASAVNELLRPSANTVVAVKIIASGKARLGIAEHCGGSIWSITAFDKSVRAKDVRAMNDEAINEKTSRMVQTLDDVFASCKVQPRWPSKLKHINMMPPDSIQLESLIPPPPEDLDSQLAYLGTHTPMKKNLDVLSVLSIKYYETLYVAQTPVSYFAKSSLSRARAMCKEKYVPFDDTPKQRVVYLEKLINVLKTMILDILDLDSKYDLHNFWQAVKSDEFSAYSREEQKCMQRWSKDLEDREPGSSIHSEEFKKGVDLLKTREIQLQIIILMEILALEASRDQKLGKVTKASPPKKPRVNIRQTGLVRLKKQPKITQANNEEESREPSTQTLAIAMFDRLCIRNLSDGSPDRFLGDTHYETPAQAAAAADKTQEFCREAIMPFFGARLPELCKKLVQSCRGNSTGLARQAKAKPASETKSEPAQRSDSLISLVPAKRNDSLASFTEGSLVKAGKTNTFRGGLSSTVNLKKAEDRRQIEMTFRSSQCDEDELRNAIKNISKPSRVSVSQQHANSLPSTQFNKQLPKRASRMSKADKSHEIEVESTPIKRKRQLTAGRTKSNTASLVQIDGKIYSTGDNDYEETIDGVIMETPAKKMRYNMSTNFNDRLASLSSSQAASRLSNTLDDVEIISSPMKTPRRDPGLVYSNSASSDPHATGDNQPLNPIYDENSPRFLFPDRSPLPQSRRNQTSIFSPSPSKLSFATTLTESGKKRKSKQWFDDAFPMTKSTSSNLF